jgi:hypothetical protein
MEAVAEKFRVNNVFIFHMLMPTKALMYKFDNGIFEDEQVPKNPDQAQIIAFGENRSPGGLKKLFTDYSAS